jgi:PAS domain S-box-containing protein
MVDFQAIALSNAALYDLIFAEPLVVDADVSVADAIAHLHQQKINGAAEQPTPHSFRDCILVQQGSQIIGIFTPADLIPLVAEGQPLATLLIGDVAHLPSTLLIPTPSQLTVLPTSDCQQFEHSTVNVQHSIKVESPKDELENRRQTPNTQHPTFNTYPPYFLAVNNQQQWLGVIAAADLVWFTNSHSLTGVDKPLSPASAPSSIERGDRQEIELSLHASEEKLHQLAGSLKEIFWITNATGTETIYISSAHEQIYGHPPEYLYRYPLSWIDAVVPEDRERVRRLWASLPQESFEMEYQIVRTDGVRRWIRDQGIAIYNEMGEVYRMGGIIEDITDRKRMEANLRQREQEFRTLAEHSPGIITRFDRQLRYTYVNPAIEQVLGLAPPEFIGKTSRELGLSNYITFPLECRLQRIFNTGQAESSKFGFPTPNGDRYYQCQLVPEFADDGSVCSVLGITIDVTQLKHAEERLKQLNEELELRVHQRTQALVQSQTALQESERRLQAIIDSSPVCIYVKDLQGRYTLVNQLCAAKKHLEPQIMFGKTDIDLVPRKLAEQWQAQDREVLKLEKAIEFEEVVAINERSETYLTLKFPLVDGTGSPYAVCGISTNITERKLVENQILASLQQKDLVIQEIHHRVKNNLQIVSSLLTLQGRSTNDKTTSQLFKDCQNRILSIALIHEQLYRSRDLTAINMAEYIRNLADQIVVSYQNSSQATELHLDLAEVFLNLDTALPCGLLINELLSNSLKYAFPQQEKGRINIQIYLEEKENKIVLVVGDNGVGLPPRFDFRQSQSLGLRLVCDLASQLKGTITLLPEQGTTFRLTFAELKSKARL